MYMSKNRKEWNIYFCNVNWHSPIILMYVSGYQLRLRDLYDQLSDK